MTRRLRELPNLRLACTTELDQTLVQPVVLAVGAAVTVPAARDVTEEEAKAPVVPKILLETPLRDEATLLAGAEIQTRCLPIAITFPDEDEVVVLINWASAIILLGA